jgi:DNA-binding CsgD family transcriptional regulator
MKGSACPCAAGHLTVREIDILLCTAMGMNAERTGRALCISRRTVEFHLAAMLRRTGAQSTVELTARCYAAGILMPEVWPPRWSGRLCLPRQEWPRATVPAATAGPGTRPGRD